MSKHIIYFESFELPHTDLYVYQLRMLYLKEFKIKDKIMSICFDNAGNDVSAIDML